MDIKRLLFLVSFLAASLVLAGCFEENEDIFEENLVEFAPGAVGSCTGAARPDVNCSATVASGVGTIGLPVQLIGAQRDSDLTVSYTINDSLTTASPDADFAVGDGSGSFVIPADSSSVLLPITINDFLEPGTSQTAQIGVTLEGNEDAGVGVAENYQTYFLNVVAAAQSEGARSARR